jgi:hypothetical protein
MTAQIYTDRCLLEVWITFSCITCVRGDIFIKDGTPQNVWCRGWCFSVVHWIAMNCLTDMRPIAASDDIWHCLWGVRLNFLRIRRKERSSLVYITGIFSSSPVFLAPFPFSQTWYMWENIAMVKEKSVSRFLPICSFQHSGLYVHAGYLTTVSHILQDGFWTSKQVFTLSTFLKKVITVIKCQLLPSHYEKQTFRERSVSVASVCWLVNRKKRHVRMSAVLL